MNKQKMNNILLISSFVVLILFVIIITYKYMDNELNSRYRDIQVYHEKNKNLHRKCPKGCIRGSCRHKGVCYDPFPPHAKCCAFDQQCRFCKDPSGIIIDKPARGNTDYINKNYYKRFRNVSSLNREIKEENEYIKHLNKDIRKKNRSILRKFHK